MEKLKLKHSSVEWANETGNCEKEYSYPARRKELEAALTEALDECLKLHRETVKLRAALKYAVNYLDQPLNQIGYQSKAHREMLDALGEGG